MSNARNLANLLGTGSTITTAKIADDAITAAKIADATFGANKNLLTNGQFQVWQRGTSITANNSNAYTADRWHAGANGSEDVVYSRQFTNTSDGTPYMRVRRTGTASGRMYLTQMIETSVLDFCRGKTVTLSFQARKHADFDATFVSRIATQTNESPRDDNVVQNSDVTRTLTTSFQTFTQSLTLTSSSNSANGFRVEFVAEDGANSSSNYYYEVRDVQLEIGSVATPIEHLPVSQVERACYRYYYDSRFGFNEGGVYSPHRDAQYGHVRAAIAEFPVTMRATPTVSIQSGSANSMDRFGRGQEQCFPKADNIYTQQFQNIVKFTSSAQSTTADWQDSGNYISRAGYKADAEL